eukprot:g72506.t1
MISTRHYATVPFVFLLDTEFSCQLSSESYFLTKLLREYSNKLSVEESLRSDKVTVAFSNGGTAFNTVRAHNAERFDHPLQYLLQLLSSQH